MWETVIGLEIHVQLATESKLFSSSSTNFGSQQNTQASIIDLAMPGVLPVLNKKAVDMAIMFGLAVDAKIADKSIFARKNYFYPDLPKGYQISQYELPVVHNGKLEINVDGKEKVIGIFLILIYYLYKLLISRYQILKKLCLNCQTQRKRDSLITII